MIRPVTLLTFCAAAAAGLQLYQIKASVIALEREIREVNRQIEAVRTRTEVLRAEWAMLNEPSRLRALAERHLDLVPLEPRQFARLADIAQRTPAPVAFAGPVMLFPPAAGGMGERALAAAPAPAAAVPAAPSASGPAPAVSAPPPAAALAAEAPRLPASREAARPAVAAGAETPRPLPRPTLAEAEPPRLRLVSTAGAEPRRIEAEPLAPPPGARAAPTPRPQPAAPAAPAAARPAPTAEPRAPARAAAPPAAPAPAVPAAPAGSLLAGAGSLPPPVPRSLSP